MLANKTEDVGAEKAYGSVMQLQLGSWSTKICGAEGQS